MWVVVRTWSVETPELWLFATRELAMQCWRRRLVEVGGADYWADGGTNYSTGCAWTEEGNHGAEVLQVIEVAAPHHEPTVQ
jgi:hypothetical protein